MKLISIIPDFQPMTDTRLLAKAEQFTPALNHTLYPAPVGCYLNGARLSPEALAEEPLARGDQVVLDFGRHMVGRFFMKLGQTGSHQDAPAFLQVAFAEIRDELDHSADDYQGWLSRSWIQREQLHVDLLPAELTLPRRYAFRYVKLSVTDTSPKYQLLLQGASCLAESSADWASVPERTFTDDQLASIYKASLATLADCTQSILEDGPKRDRRLWLGDLRLQALTSYVSFRSCGLIKRCLYLFAGTRFPDGRMSANVFTDGTPVADDTYLADYALMMLPTLDEYLAETGDREALDDLLGPALEQVDYVLGHCLTEQLTIDEACGESSFIDWSDGLDRRAAVQGVLICALDAAASLCARAGDHAKQQYYADKAADLRRSAREQFWSETRQCFVSGGQVSIHSQVWMTLANVTCGPEAIRAMENALSAGEVRMGSPYMHHYYVMALLQAGDRDKAENHLREYWGSMLDAGADTFWECWDPADPGASPYGGIIVNSFCHAWSCTPAYIIDRFLSE